MISMGDLEQASKKTEAETSGGGKEKAKKTSKQKPKKALGFFVGLP
jgi:hypothetical protein